MQTLLIETRSVDPEMISDDDTVIVDTGSGPDYYRKNDVLSLLHSNFPGLARTMETQGKVNVFAQNPKRFETFKQLLKKIPQLA